MLLSFWPINIIFIWLKLFSLSQSGGPAQTVEILQPEGTSFLEMADYILYSQMLVEEDIFQVDATITNLSQKNSLDCDIFEGEGDPSRHTERQEEQVRRAEP